MVKKSNKPQADCPVSDGSNRVTHKDKAVQQHDPLSLTTKGTVLTAQKEIADIKKPFPKLLTSKKVLKQ